MWSRLLQKTVRTSQSVNQLWHRIRQQLTSKGKDPLHQKQQPKIDKLNCKRQKRKKSEEENGILSHMTILFSLRATGGGLKGT